MFLESYCNTQKGSYLQQQTNSPPNQSSAETQSTAVETFSFVDVVNNEKNYRDENDLFKRKSLW